MMPSTIPKNSTTVRLPFSPRWVTGPLKVAPFLEEPLLTRLFLSPVRRAKAPRDAAGPVIGTVRVGEGLVKVRARGRGPVVLLAHGWQGSSGHLMAIADRVVSCGYTAVSFDMPAHGETSGRSTSMPEFAETLLGAARLVGPVHAVVAHSLGALAASFALSRGLQVQTAVLIAPLVSFDFALDEFARMLGLSPRLREVAAVGAETRLGVSRAEANILTLQVPEIPIAIVHDRDDQRTPYLYSRRLVQRWPWAELTSTSGFGHKRLLGAEEVLAVVERQLARAPGPAVAPLEFPCAPELRL